jgi:HEAT repeat protein
VRDQSLARVVLNASLPDEARVSAAEMLSRMKPPEALDALLAVAQDPDASTTVARAAGTGVARILLNRDAVKTAPLTEFTPDAYLAFDETVGRAWNSGSET